MDIADAVLNVNSVDIFIGKSSAFARISLRTVSCEEVEKPLLWRVLSRTRIVQEENRRKVTVQSFHHRLREIEDVDICGSNHCVSIDNKSLDALTLWRGKKVNLFLRVS